VSGRAERDEFPWRRPYPWGRRRPPSRGAGFPPGAKREQCPSSARL